MRTAPKYELKATDLTGHVLEDCSTWEIHLQSLIILECPTRRPSTATFILADSDSWSGVDFPEK